MGHRRATANRRMASRSSMLFGMTTASMWRARCPAASASSILVASPQRRRPGRTQTWHEPDRLARHVRDNHAGVGVFEGERAGLKAGRLQQEPDALDAVRRDLASLHSQRAGGINFQRGRHR
uniref:Uncharacterized protein n=1 Tax=Alexandrium monilatum TaxID=311494 RepID=A0A7S4SJX6_9DINO